MVHVGWVGPGLMGHGMAANILAAGHEVTVYARRDKEAVARLVERGARAADTLGDLAPCNVIGMCVTNAPAVEAVIEALLPTIAARTLVIDASTSLPDTSVALAERLRAAGARFADAPVTGGPKQAEQGVLGSLVGCAQDDFEEVESIVGCYSATVRRFGEVGTGHAAKLLNNFVTQGTQALLTECYTRARAMGVDTNALYDVMMRGNARSGTLENSVGPALEGRFDGSRFALANALKDVTYYCDVAEASHGPSPLGAQVRNVLQTVCDAGHGERFVPAMLSPEVAEAIRTTWLKPSAA